MKSPLMCPTPTNAHAQPEVPPIQAHLSTRVDNGGVTVCTVWSLVFGKVPYIHTYEFMRETRGNLKDRGPETVVINDFYAKTGT